MWIVDRVKKEAITEEVDVVPHLPIILTLMVHVHLVAFRKVFHHVTSGYMSY